MKLCFRFLAYRAEEIAAVGVDPDRQRQVIGLDDPDRLGHAEVFKIDAAKPHACGGERGAPPREREVDGAPPELLDHLRPHTAFTDEGADARIDEESVSAFIRADVVGPATTSFPSCTTGPQW